MHFGAVEAMYFYVQRPMLLCDIHSFLKYFQYAWYGFHLIYTFLLNILSEAFFLRVHKSFLINLRHVKEYQRGEGGFVIMSNNTEIEVSRRKKEQFLVKIKEVFRF